MTKRRLVIGIAGGSGSGKTTLAHRVIEDSAKAGIDGHLFSLDNYYKALDHLSAKRRAEHNFDHPDAIEFKLATEHLKALIAGQTIEQPVYDYALHTRKSKTVTCRPTSLIVVEGLYALYAPLLPFYHYRVFVSTGIATAVLRRMTRDVKERGRDLEGAKKQIITTVLPMYEAYAKPTQRHAHFLINWEGEEIPDRSTEGLVRMVRDYFQPSR